MRHRITLANGSEVEVDPDRQLLWSLLCRKLQCFPANELKIGDYIVVHNDTGKVYDSLEKPECNGITMYPIIVLQSLGPVC